MAAYWGNEVEDAARLEAALQRIAEARRALLKSAPSEAPQAILSPAATEEAARRLDSLIAEIRAVLGKDAAD
jgi:hypothetical protein